MNWKKFLIGFLTCLFCAAMRSLAHSAGELITDIVVCAGAFTMYDYFTE